MAQVVSAAHRQMARLVTALGFSNDIQSNYVSSLLETFPDSLSVCYLTNSGSEANDLALRLARYNKNSLHQKDHTMATCSIHNYVTF